MKNYLGLGLAKLAAAAAAVVGVDAASKMTTADHMMATFVDMNDRVDWARRNAGIRGGRPKLTPQPRSLDSDKQRQRYSQQRDTIIYNRGVNFFSVPDQVLARPSGDGPTEFFGVRQQRRAWARRQTKNAAKEERRTARREATKALRARQKAREEVDSGAELAFLAGLGPAPTRRSPFTNGLATIYGEKMLGRISNRRFH